MALADVTVPDCSFHWDIHHPFTPWRTLIATFYHGSSLFTQWKVNIVPLKRKINWWSFRFHLEMEKYFDGGKEITAKRVQVGIFLHNRCICEKDVANVLFSPRNLYTYSFCANASANALQDQELLVVKITLDLPEKAADNQHTIDDSRWLSEDLLQLFINRFQSDMQFRSSTGDILPAHACILDARCHKFLIDFPMQGIDMEVNVNISGGVLRDILTYLYSGVAPFGWPNNKDANYITELFYAMKKYKLKHLERVVRKRDMQQRRISERDANTVTLTFPLGELVSCRIVFYQQEWCVNQNTPYEFFFRIYVQTYSYSGPWLSYSLRSNSGKLVYVQVNLDIRKTLRTVELPCYQITHVHQHDYTIHPKSFEQSENVLFLGCPETFRNFELANNPAQIVEGCDSILWTLKFTNGRILDQIQSTVDDLDAEEDEMERFNLLGDHLFELFSSGLETDLMIMAPTENENQPYEIYPIHKAIFAARVPRWWKVFQDDQEPGDMPREVRLILRSEALPFVLRYIYSSRTDYVSPSLFNDIQHFAFTGGSHSLHAHIIRIRNEQVTVDSDSE